jgi:hypothetical protein
MTFHTEMVCNVADCGVLGGSKHQGLTLRIHPTDVISDIVVCDENLGVIEMGEHD